jgi:hypothetical protein
MNGNAWVKKTGQMNGEEKDVPFIFIKNDF